MAGFLAVLPGLDALADDDALVIAAQADREAFGEIYQHYLARVYRYLRSRCQSAEEAADLTQAVFTRAFAALPSYRLGRTPFAAWLFRIARNTAADSHRRRARRPETGLDALSEELIDSRGRSLEEDVLHRERLIRLRALVVSLDKDKQELLALRFGAGLSAREIGAVIGKSEAAVKKQMSRTLSALKEHYRDEL